MIAETVTLTTEMTQEELATNEAIVAHGLATFKEVGGALLAIRDRRGYRFEYGTFEDYCRERWGMARQRANQLIDAAKTFANLTTMVVIPENERQARPLAELRDNPELQREAWQRAVETAPNGKITAAHVEQAVDEVLKRPHVTHNSGNNEWYTPPEYIEAAKAVLGEIDLDPASSEIANQTVGAKQYYSKEDDGLSKEWRGRVWMNPPYASEWIGKFSEKLAQHFNEGNVTEAIVLVNNATETNWFQTLLICSSAVCFMRQRVKFVDMDGNPSGAPLQGQAILYLGDHAGLFAKAFEGLGHILYGNC